MLTTILTAGWVLHLAPIIAQAKESVSGLELARQLNQAFIEVADKVSPAVVVIKVAHKPNYIDFEDEDNPFWDMLPPELRKQFQERFKPDSTIPEERENRRRPSNRKPEFGGLGSGVVIREEGYILTNRHVVDGAEKIQVRFKDDPTWHDAEVRGVDAQSDVAVIKIDPKGRKLTLAKLGNSDHVNVGEFAIAIGAPFELDYSVTFGHVSAKGRTHIIGGLQGAAMDQDFLQTDANINPGNSGGPLINISGEIIGINTLIRGLHTGIGFAIPINLAKGVAEKLISDGKYVRAWLGVGIKALRDDPEYSEMVSGVKDGVVVDEIRAGGPAAKSDLRAGDVITAVDGKSVITAPQLKSEIRTKKIGHVVSLDVHRNGKNIKVKVKTEALPDEATLVASSRIGGREPEAQNFGMTVKPLTQDLASQFGVEKAEGLVVTEVERGSEAERKGIRPGDLITEINQKSVTSVKQFRDALKESDPKKGVIINFTSRGTSKFEVLKDSGD